MPPGNYDLLATRCPNAGLPDKIYLRRSIQAPGNYTVDFNDPQHTFAPENRSVTIIDGDAYGYVFFRTSNGTKLEVGSGRNDFNFASIPTSKQVAKDVHILTVSYPLLPPPYITSCSPLSRKRRQGEQIEGGDFRQVIQLFKTPTNRVVSLPEPFGSVTFQVATETPYCRLSATWTPYPNAQAYGLVYNSDYVIWQIGLSTGWLSGSTTYTLPDLSNVPGWTNTWALPNGRVVYWEVNTITSNNQRLSKLLQLLYGFEYPDGVEVKVASRSDYRL